MKEILLVVAALVVCSWPAVADDLDDVAATCAPHVHVYPSITVPGASPAPYRPPVLDKGWENSGCERIINEQATRAVTQEAADAEKNPEFAKVLDMKRKLEGK